MKEMICRLCLQTIGNNSYQPVEEYLSKYLKLNTNISKENVMCIGCANCLQAFSNFTPGCVYMGDGALPLSYLKDGVKLDPEAIETATNPMPLMKTEIKCRFCTNAHGREDLVSLQVSKKNKILLGRYISEMNLKNTEELLTCETCLESLESVSSVILKCLEGEEKISKYIESEGTDDKGQVELREVQQFRFGPILKSKIESFGVNELEGRSDQVQEEYTVMAAAKIKYEKEISDTALIIKTEDVDIKSEQSDCDIPTTILEQSDCNGFQKQFVENKSPSEIKMKMFQCEFCSYHTKWKSVIAKHLLIHKSPSEIQMFKCESCSYEAKRKSDLKGHLLTHKSPSEIKMFQCEFCSYQTKWKRALISHLLVHHENPSDMKMFKCEICSHQTKHRSALTVHLLTHKNPSEIKMFKCEICPYEAKRKIHLETHLLIHKNPSEIKTFKCGMCSYETILKSNLKRHLLTHKNPSEIKMFKCELCSYEAKQKSNLKIHLLAHKNPSEIKMFKCEMCSYEAKQKRYLKTHLLSHKNPSEIKMFKCELCSYEAKFKNSLVTHLLTHKNTSEIKMFKCESCSYQTKRKYEIKRHLLTHT